MHCFRITALFAAIEVKQCEMRIVIELIRRSHFLFQMYDRALAS